MKKLILKFGITALAIFTLAACSSGGGSESTAAPAVPQANNNVAQNQTQPNPTQNNPVQSVPAVASYSLSGDKLSVTGSGINRITVEGQELDLTYDANPATIWRSKSGLSCCSKFTDVRVGAGRIGDLVNFKDIVFYTGNETQTMPESGVVIYNGYGLIHRVAAPGYTTDDTQGYATFTADFNTKKLTGSFGNADVGYETVSINAAIIGNGFSGTANSPQLGQGKTEGKFYGENAKELGGVVLGDDKTWAGAFAAQQ